MKKRLGLPSGLREFGRPPQLRIDEGDEATRETTTFRAGIIVKRLG
jgi:hypothetical protein